MVNELQLQEDGRQTPENLSHGKQDSMANELPQPSTQRRTSGKGFKLPTSSARRETTREPKSDKSVPMATEDKSPTRDNYKGSISQYKDPQQTDLANKGKGTTRSGKIIAGSGLIPNQLPKTLRHESENLGQENHKTQKGTKAGIDKSSFREEALESQKLLQSTQEARLRNSLSEEMKQTSKKVLKKLSRELCSIHGIEKSKAQHMALTLEGKILSVIFADHRIREDEVKLIHDYKGKVVELIKNLKVG